MAWIAVSLVIGSRKSSQHLPIIASTVTVTTSLHVSANGGGLDGFDSGLRPMQDTTSQFFEASPNI